MRVSRRTSKAWKYLEMTFPNLANMYFFASWFCFRFFSTLLHRITTTSSRPDTTALSFPKRGSACWDTTLQLTHTHTHTHTHTQCMISTQIYFNFKALLSFAQQLQCSADMEMKNSSNKATYIMKYKNTK